VNSSITTVFFHPYTVKKGLYRKRPYNTAVKPVNWYVTSPYAVGNRECVSIMHYMTFYCKILLKLCFLGGNNSFELSYNLQLKKCKKTFSKVPV